MGNDTKNKKEDEIKKDNSNEKEKRTDWNRKIDINLTEINENNKYSNQCKIKLDEFMNKMIIQDYYPKNMELTDDLVFNALKKTENNKLDKIFNDLKNDYEKNVLAKKDLNLSIDNNIIKDIINYENTEKVYKEKIIKEIESRKNDDKYGIEHLTVLLVGLKDVGKTTLINYMLKLDESNQGTQTKKQNFVTYTSNKVPHLKLVEFKGIGHDKDNIPEIIAKEALECIQGEIENNKNTNYNDFIHCIWYCISGTRLEKAEQNLLQKLRNAYDKDQKIPVIMVYTKSQNDEIINQMKEYIKEIEIDTGFVKVLAKDIVLPNNQGRNYSFGDEELIHETLKRCTKALKGNMISLITQTMSNIIEDYMKKRNLSIEEKINEKIINNFIEKYKCVLFDKDFKNYIVNLLGMSLFDFYGKTTSNKSLNLLKNSEIIKSLEGYIKYYKKQLGEKINNIVDTLSKDLLDRQATFEKQQKENIYLKNKRDLNGFKKTHEIYLKRNFYYISQKYMINYIIRNISWKFFENYRKEIDSIITTLLQKDYDIDIKKYLEDCFLTQLERFAKNNGLQITIEYPEKNNLFDEKQDKKDEEKYIEEDINNSIDLNYNFNIDKKKQNKKNKKGNNEENWYPIKKKNWKNLTKESESDLINFIQNDKEYQYSPYFKEKESNDKVFNELKKEEKDDLIKYFDSHKRSFIIEKINETYRTKYIYYNKLAISQILSEPKNKEIIINKIFDEIGKLIEDNYYYNIKYLSVLVIGKNGVGKTSLIQQMLKLDNMDKIKNKDESYKSYEMPFLQLFDTKGIILEDNYNPSIILKNILKVLEEQKKEIENNSYHDYINDYIQCIWYCISNDELKENEINFIKEMKKKKRALPLILVFTKAEDKNKVKNCYNKIREEVKDVSFIPISSTELFGFENLLNETIQLCGKAIKGNVYTKIREKSFEKIDKKYKRINETNKKNITNDMVKIIISDFKKVLKNYKDDKNDKEGTLYYHILKKFEIIFCKFMKSYNNNNENINFEMKDLLNKITDLHDFLQKYNQHYINNTDKIIKSIIDNKAIEFLDEQVRKEKQNKTHLNIENKYNKNDFMKIIRTFLMDNFSYISQKYIIYRVITDVIEDITEAIENIINNIIKDFLSQRKPDDILGTIFFNKYQKFEDTINEYRKNGKIYNENEKLYKFNDISSSKNLNNIHDINGNDISLPLND